MSINHSKPSLITEDFQVFIKPVGARCNLKCSYCYYINNDRNESDIMSDETLEKCIKQLFEASLGDTVLFTWHGGEPLLAGIKFYEKAISMQQREVPQGKRFLNGMQTNGTLITKEWSTFLASHRFVVGISIDGPKVFHDAMRQTYHNRGSFEKTIQGYHQLRACGVLPEILCVVNECNVHHPLVVYDFFKKLGAKYITFLPFVENRHTQVGHSSLTSVPALAFGLFLSVIFEEWVKNDIGVIKIQIFEEALRTAFNQEHSLCIFRERCGGVPVIELNGDFYSCDHYVDKKHLLGNIHKHPINYFLTHPVQRAFGEAKQNSLPLCCLQCNVKTMCHGECPKNRFTTSPDGETGLNYLCQGYSYFFNRCKPFINSVSELFFKERDRAFPS